MEEGEKAGVLREKIAVPVSDLPVSELDNNPIDKLDTNPIDKFSTQIAVPVSDNNPIDKFSTQMALLSSTVTRLEGYITQLRTENVTLLSNNIKLRSDISILQGDLRTLHPLPYARLHLKNCTVHQAACNSAMTSFTSLHSLTSINSNPLLTLQFKELKKAIKASNTAFLSAACLCKPTPTLASVLWIIAKNGNTDEVKRCMNLNRAIRNCPLLQMAMAEVKSPKVGLTQLNYFSWKGKTASVKRMLMIKDIDLESSDSCGFTPLLSAALYGHAEIVKLLLAKGSKIDAKTSEGFTALHAACQSGNLAIVSLLVNKKAEIEARSVFNSTPFHLAATKGNLDVFKFLLDKGARIESKDNFGRSVLHFVCQEGHTPLLKLLFLTTVDLQDRTTDGGLTPLHYAAMNGHLGVIRALADKGVDLNALTDAGITALEFSKRGNHQYCIYELLNRGAI